MKRGVQKQLDRNTQAMKTVNAILTTKIVHRYGLPISDSDLEMVVVDIIVACDRVKLLKYEDLEEPS